MSRISEPEVRLGKIYSGILKFIPAVQNVGEIRPESISDVFEEATKLIPYNSFQY